MTALLFGLGLCVLLGALYVGLRWKTISAIGRSIVGDRVNVAIPILILIWPFLVLGWVSDGIKVAVAVYRANAMMPRCQCGEILRVTGAEMRALRDGRHAELRCTQCGEVTDLKPERA